MSSSRALFRLVICIVATTSFFLQCIVKKIVRFGFCDIRNDQGPGKGYQCCKCCFTMKIFQFSWKRLWLFIVVNNNKR